MTPEQDALLLPSKVLFELWNALAFHLFERNGVDPTRIAALLEERQTLHETEHPGCCPDDAGFDRLAENSSGWRADAPADIALKCIDLFSCQLAARHQCGGDGFDRVPVQIDKFSRLELHQLDKTPRVGSQVSRRVIGDLQIDVLTAGRVRTSL